MTNGIFDHIRQRLHRIIDARISLSPTARQMAAADRNISDALSEFTKIRQSLQTHGIGPAAVGGWDGEIDPFVFHRYSAINSLSEGVAAVYGYDVDGAIAEFGTMSGETAKGLARAIASSDKYLAHAVSMYRHAPRKLFLFDSFVGLPESETGSVDAKSPHVVDRVWSAGTCRGITKEELGKAVEEYLPAERYEIFAGWFSDTVPKLDPATRFALLHIDSDLYSSAMDVMDTLFARGAIAKGAYIYFDDWNCNRADPEFGERRAWRECVEKYGIQYSDEGGYGIFARRFCIHSYKGHPEPL